MTERHRDGNSDLWRLTLGEREPEALTNDPVDEFGGDLSPDGRQLVFYSYPEGSGRGVVWVKPMDGGPAQRVNKTGDYGIWPEWMPDGKEIAWGCPPRDIDSRSRLVARLDDLTRPSYRPDFAVGSGRIYFTINDRQSNSSVVQLIER